MTSLRENLAVDGIAGTEGGAAPLVDINGLEVKSAPPIPTLLVGVRSEFGFEGYADAAEGVDLSSGDSAMIGSQTKTFTAAAILQLDQEGELSITDTLADPKWAKALRWPNGDDITLEMVLSHTAGIPDFTATPQFQEKIGDPTWQPSPEELLEPARKAPPTFPPGKGWSYSNTDYIILGVIIEQVTGNSYEEEMESRFFGPLGLSDTHLYDQPPGRPSMPGYVLSCIQEPPANGGGDAMGPPPCPGGKGEWIPVGAPEDNVWPAIWAAGGIMSTTKDMTAWYTSLVASDDVLDAEHRKLMQTPTEQSKTGIAKELPLLADTVVGDGLGLFEFDYDIGTGYGHPGNIPGYASNTVYFPEEGNEFAATIVAGESDADVAEEGGNDIFTAVSEQLP